MTQELQAELHQGVLVRFFGGFYVAADADGQEYTLRCPKKFRHQRLSPLVGDAVRFTPGQGEEEGWLVEILPRKTECIRPPLSSDVRFMEQESILMKLSTKNLSLVRCCNG